MDSRAAAVPALHVGHHRQAQGHHAHDRRLPDPGHVHPQVRVRLHPDDDVYWCTADVGWVTGHSYIVYGPLANGATHVMYEGVPNHPGNDRFWEIIEKYKVTQLLHRADGDPHVHEVGRPRSRPSTTCRQLQLSSARSASRSTPKRGCGTTSTSAAAAARSSTRGGRPRPAAIMISPLPGATTTKPGSATFPLPGIAAEVVDDAGKRRRARRRLPDADPAVAGDAARHLGRPASATARRTGVAVPRTLLRRRRRQARRRRLPVAARPRRRRHERVRPPHLDHRGRVGAGLAPVASPRRQSSAPTMPPPARRSSPTSPCAAAPTSTVDELRDHVGTEIGAHRQAEDHLLHPRSAQDPQRQDHAPPAARRRRGAQPRATPPPSPTPPSSTRSSSERARHHRRSDANWPPPSTPEDRWRRPVERSRRSTSVRRHGASKMPPSPSTSISTPSLDLVCLAGWVVLGHHAELGDVGVRHAVDMADAADGDRPLEVERPEGVHQVRSCQPAVHRRCSGERVDDVERRVVAGEHVADRRRRCPAPYVPTSARYCLTPSSSAYAGSDGSLATTSVNTLAAASPAGTMNCWIDWQVYELRIGPVKPPWRARVIRLVQNVDVVPPMITSGPPASSWVTSLRQVRCGLVGDVGDDLVPGLGQELRRASSCRSCRSRC